jgi:60 kDa SS-A/Ro ribonucleoprotein
MQLNTIKKVFTHEGGKAVASLTPLQQLRRSVMACMLWEDNFYEDGESIANRIKMLVPLVDPLECSKLAVSAREDGKLRHAPLLIACEMTRYIEHKRYVSRLLQRIITRPDMMTEFMALYFQEGKRPIAHKIKQGLARCFNKFDEYQFAKYDRATPIKLRDVMFLVHPKPMHEAQAALFKRIANRELVTPDTWEVALSSGADKGETFTRLMADHKLGALAFLRNLRNMRQAGVESQAILSYALTLNMKNILPFQIIAAALNADTDLPMFLEIMLTKCVMEAKQLPGKTVVLVDVSGSMFGTKISAKSTLDRYDAAAALAIIINDIGETVSLYTFSNDIIGIEGIRGLKLHAALRQSQDNAGTNLRNAIDRINAAVAYDRIIVITDEQSHDGIAAPRRGAKGYCINVSTNQNGVGYGAWTHIDGFSAATIEYIREHEVLTEGHENNEQ